MQGLELPSDLLFPGLSACPLLPQSGGRVLRLSEFLLRQWDLPVQLLFPPDLSLEKLFLCSHPGERASHLL